MSKHMTLDDRITIRIGLESGDSLSQIADRIGKCETTVSREVRAHRSVCRDKPYGRVPNACVHRASCTRRMICSDKPDCARKCSSCRLCNERCPDFREESCVKLSQPPYVCNACPSFRSCTLQRFIYSPDQADKEYRTTLSDARKGFNLTQELIDFVNALVSPLILQGQSVHHVYVLFKDVLPFCEETLYRLIDAGLLEARNIDLERKCALKLKRRKGDNSTRKVDRACRVGRTYNDYLTFRAEHPDLNAVQMDSVIGCAGSKKVLLTFHFYGHFMPVFIRNDNTAQGVIDWVNFLYDGLGHDDFCKLFPVILTDNGTEFSDPEAIETAPDGRIRTRVFYCDPMSPYQKPDVERNHELFRKIFPKGTSFDRFTQEDMALAASHVNSYARASLNDQTPIDMLTFMFGEALAGRFLRLLCLRRIAPEKIVLKPELLKR